VELSAGRESLGGSGGRPAVLGKRRRTSQQPQQTGSTEDSGQCSSGGETGTVAGGRTRRSVRQRVPRAWDVADGVATDGGASPMDSDDGASDEDGERSLLNATVGVSPPTAHLGSCQSVTGGHLDSDCCHEKVSDIT